MASDAASIHSVMQAAGERRHSDGWRDIMRAICKVGMTLVVLAAIGVLVAYEAPRLVKA